MRHKLTESDILIALLLAGDSSPQTIANMMNRHAGSISRTGSELVDQGLIVKKSRYVYALTPEGFSAARTSLRRRAESADPLVIDR